MGIKIAIADDHAITIKGVASMLDECSVIELVGTYENSNKLLDGLKSIQPNILLLDIHMPDMQGDELAKVIKTKYPSIAILVLTNMDQVFYVRNMFMNGVKGYLLKSTSKETLIEAIETINKGNQFVDPVMREQIAYELLDANKALAKPMLTKREQSILELIASEYTNVEIAQKLFVSISTVETHRLNLFFKLGVKNAAGLVRKGIQLGLIGPR